MRTQLGVICSAVMLALRAHAGIIYSPFANSGDIPNGGVKLQISKGNGELYAYLSDDGVLVPVSSRIAVGSGSLLGSSEAGLDNLTLSDSGSANIHVAGNGVSSGTYKPKGQDTCALRSAASFNGRDDSILFGDPSLGCVGLESNRTWTLFLGDLRVRARSQERDSSLEITAVPKEGNLPLGMVAGVGVFLVAVLARSRPVRHWAHSRRVAVVRWIDAV
jgi:hypothetical protein